MWDDLLDKLVPLSYTQLGYRLRHRNWNDAPTSLKGRVYVITGANAGLGRATAEALAKRGATLHLLCRNPERGEEAAAALKRISGAPVSLHIVDLSQQASIRSFVDRFLRDAPCVDVLINNAGVLLDTRQLTHEGIETTFATNTLGPLLLTELLRPALLRADAPRVINVTSGGMYAAKLVPDDLQYDRRTYDGVRAYAETKRAEVVLTRRWSQDPSWARVFFAAVHPGWADTGGVQRSLPTFWKVTQSVLRSPEQGADTIIWLASRDEDDVSGSPNGALWFDRRVRPEHQLPNTRNTRAEEDDFLARCRALTDLT